MKLFLLLLFSFSCIFNFAKGQSWESDLDSANYYKNNHQNEKAVELYLKTKNTVKADTSKSTIIADVNDSIASIYVAEQNYKSAEGLYLESKQIRGSLYGQNSLPYAQSCFDLGYIYTQFLDRYNEAIRLLDTTRMILEAHSQKQTLEYAFALKYSGSCHTRIGESQNALRDDLEARAITDAILGEENMESAKIIYNIGNIYSGTANYLMAETYYKDAIALFEKLSGKTNYFYLGSVNSLARLYFTSFQSYKALPLLLTTKKTIDSILGGKNFLYYYNLDLLGEVYTESDDLGLAEEYLNKAAEYYKTTFGEESENYASSCCNFGRLYFHLGQYGKAERSYLQCKRIRGNTTGKNTSYYSWCCKDLAELYIKMKRFKEADSLLLEAKQIDELREGRNTSLIVDCNNLGNLYILTRQYKKAERVLLDAKEIIDVMAYNDKFQNADISSSLGDLNCLIENYDEARKYYNISMRIIESQESAETMDNIEIIRKLAILDWCQHQTDSSLSKFSRCLSFQMKGLQRIFQFTSQSEKQSYVSQVSDLSDYYFSFVLNSSKKVGLGTAYNTSVSNRNIILESFEQLNKGIYTSTDTLQRKKYREWLDTKRELANFYTHSTDQSSNISALEEKANKQEKSLTSFISSIQKDRDPGQITWKKIQEKLLPNEAAIEFLSFRYYDAYRSTDSVFYAALILRKGMPGPDLVRLCEQKALDTILSKLHSNGNAAQISTLYTRGIPVQGNMSMDKSIYDILWKPIESKLKGVGRVYYALAGELHKISFAALPIDAHTFLSDQYELIQLDNTASILDHSSYSVSKTDDIQLFGGINYDNDSTETPAMINDQESLKVTRSSDNGSSWAFLPGTQKEITNISAIGRDKKFTIRVSLGSDANEAAIKSLNGAASPEILHIATHGFFFPDPKEAGIAAADTNQNGMVFRRSQDPLLRSGLILAGANNAWKGNIHASADDGILTAYEISNMYLPNTKLVVLSACETALGDIKGSEGVYGLQRAFKMAGVQNLVMSLWKVPDEETSEFMDLFYQNIFSGQPIHRAFYLAQSYMKNKYRNTPYKWAAWILIR
jgi:CHAT domain-containing protein